MAQINQLPSISAFTSSDLLPLFRSNNFDSGKGSVSLLQTYMQDNLTFTQSTLFTEYSSPLTGSTVTLGAEQAGSNIHLIITPAATIAALTLKLPAFAGVVDKEEVVVNTTQTITTLTVDANGATAVIGAPSTLSANEFFRLKYDVLMKTWYRIG